MKRFASGLEGLHMRLWRHFMFAFLLFCLTLQAEPVQAQREEALISVNGTVARFDGPIEYQKSYREFREAIRFHRITYLELNSSGGSLDEAILLAEAIRDIGLITIIREGDTCASACAMLFLAGDAYFLDGRLDVHQFTVPGDYGDVGDAQHFAGELFALLDQFNVSPRIIKDMLQTPNEDMAWYERDDLPSLYSLVEQPANSSSFEGPWKHTAFCEGWTRTAGAALLSQYADEPGYEFAFFLTPHNPQGEVVVRDFLPLGQGAAVANKKNGSSYWFFKVFAGGDAMITTRSKCRLLFHR